MKDLKVKAKIENFEVLMGFIEETLVFSGFHGKEAIAVVTACEELIVNVINYAYPGSEGNIEVKFDTEKNSILLTFTDDGVPFNPLKIPEVDTQLLAHEREIGGLGIHMVKKLMDEVRYEYKEGRNILTIKKTFKDSTS